MSNSSMNFVKGLGTGMLAGAAAVVVGKIMINDNNRNITKGSTKLVKAAGDIVDGIQTMFK